MARPQRDLERILVLQAGLKHLVTRLSEAELLLVRSWVEEEIRLARTGGLRLVTTPSAEDPAVAFAGSSIELLGFVRRQIHELPEDRLLVLLMWVHSRLSSDYGIE